MSHLKFTSTHRIRSPRIHQSGDGRDAIVPVDWAGQGLGLSGMGSAIDNIGFWESGSLRLENSENSAKLGSGVVVELDGSDRFTCDHPVQDRLAPDHPIRYQLGGLRPTTGSGRYRCNLCNLTVLTQD